MRCSPFTVEAVVSPTAVCADATVRGIAPVLPHDRGRRFQANAHGAALVDEGTPGGNPPDEILGGQYPRHPATTLGRSRVGSRTFLDGGRAVISV
jgi:hypothetical protein